MGSKSYFKDMKNSFLDFMDPFLQEYGFYQKVEKVNKMIGWRAMCFLLFLVAYGVGLTLSQMRTCRRLASRRTMTTGHLSYYKQRRWNGRLRGRFEKKLQLRGLIFMTLWLNTYAMDQEQMARMLDQVMNLANAATTAARASSSVMEKMENRRDGGGFSEASKILRPPETFDVDDPMKYVAWKESFTNWLTYGNYK